MNHHCSRRRLANCGYKQIPVLKEMVRFSNPFLKWIWTPRLIDNLFQTKAFFRFFPVVVVLYVGKCGSAIQP